ncbi:hypothetical protein RIF29_15406 [Crotalaria pallida]|uniref:Uncharacterized protein n=1 Tax=Crotalaria pallida TaxID=3830 RepID=A0AAN9FLR3_CROPI
MVTEFFLPLLASAVFLFAITRLIVALTFSSFLDTFLSQITGGIHGLNPGFLTSNLKNFVHDHVTYTY